ncbi:hypothetical protein Baya_15518 [Bagarius yarrelli]|uniref:Uncharacterized protein n=1 Tax=Bagarius yarrelli TaxID=175774 RepID=A0A556VBZ1_BAGYA|nr:hypothetical protein Baya_15518 [Bagarius yarrelli]
MRNTHRSGRSASGVELAETGVEYEPLLLNILRPSGAEPDCVCVSEEESVGDSGLVCVVKCGFSSGVTLGGVREALSVCRRRWCVSRQKVWGPVGEGGGASRWKVCSAEAMRRTHCENSQPALRDDDTLLLLPHTHLNNRLMTSLCLCPGPSPTASQNASLLDIGVVNGDTLVITEGQLPPKEEEAVRAQDTISVKERKNEEQDVVRRSDEKAVQQNGVHEEQVQEHEEQQEEQEETEEVKPQENGPQENRAQENGPQENGPQENGPQENEPQENRPQENGPQESETPLTPQNE